MLHYQLQSVTFRKSLFFWVVRSVKVVFAVAISCFSEHFQSTMNLSQCSLFCFKEGTSVTSAVRRPKLFALYTFSNKLSSRESCSVPKIFPQWNTVLMSGDSSSHEDQTISVWEIWISHFPFDKLVCCAMCLKYEVISVKFLFFNIIIIKLGQEKVV